MLKFKDAAGIQDGIEKLVVKAGRGGRDTIRFKLAQLGPRPRLPKPVSSEHFFPPDEPLVIQLVNAAGGCWQAVLEAEDFQRNRADAFKARSR